MAALSVALLLAGCLPELPERDPYLLKAPPPPQGIREIPHTFALGLISGRNARSVTLEAFNTGQVRVRGEAVSSMKSYGSKIKMAAPAFLVRHSSAGLILIGTGLGTKERRPRKDLENVVRYLASIDYGFKYKQKRKKDLVTQLVRKGVDPADVGHVIIPFWSPESVGNIDAFPNAKIVINRPEWEWRRGLREGKEPRPLDPQNFDGKIKVKVVDAHIAPAFGVFENGLDLLGDGSIVLVSLPGRSPGNMGVWLNLNNGPVLLAGGACYVVDNFLDFALPVKGKISDLKDYWRSLHIIRKMAEGVPQLLVVPGNDLTPLGLSRRPDIMGATRNK
jgi:N-acyl homoserine lactone hydrolase